jgi:hypothetical protein
LHCLNCSSALTGPWCANCGQKHQPDIHTFGHFAGEAFENITHADSRLWRTLWILVAKPGQLTREFFSGRRARYLPPVRFYLVLSLVFFLLVGLVGSNSPNVVRLDAKDVGAAGSDPKSKSEKVCKDFDYDGPYKAWVLQRMEVQCRKIVADNGRNLVTTLINNMPKALFVLLPLLAAFMKLLYWRPRRYYVEHLLFLLHNHTLVFIGYGMLILLGWVLPDSAITNFMAVAFHGYLLWYLYRGMRVVYSQGRALTMGKYFLLGMVYLITATATLVVTLLFSAAMI